MTPVCILGYESAGDQQGKVFELPLSSEDSAGKPFRIFLIDLGPEKFGLTSKIFEKVIENFIILD